MIGGDQMIGICSVHEHLLGDELQGSLHTSVEVGVCASPMQPHKGGVISPSAKGMYSGDSTSSLISIAGAAARGAPSRCDGGGPGGGAGTNDDEDEVEG